LHTRRRSGQLVTRSPPDRLERIVAQERRQVELGDQWPGQSDDVIHVD
jgi:hypothetical protein